MMSSHFRVASLMSLGLAGALVVAPALAYMPQRVAVAAVEVAASDGPAFRDPKTGQVWTPENVGHDNAPTEPGDRAFDPTGQVVSPGEPVDEHVQTRHVGSVPITAGPAVPLVAIDNLSLKVQPGGRWHAVLYLQNNSANVRTPVLGCAFSNAGQPVQKTRVLLPAVAAGERVGIVVTGPTSDIYVDLIACRVISP